MPKIERTERQVAVRGSYQPDLPGNGGRAIGEGLSSLGNAISGLGAQQTEQEMFDAKMKVSEYTFREQMAQDQAIADYNPAAMPADQFGATYEQERAARDQEFAGQFKNPKVRQYAMLHTQQARQSAAARTQNARQGFVQQENVGRVMAHTARVGSTITGEPDSVVEAHKALDGSIEAIPGLTPGQRNVLRARASKELWSQWIGKADEDQLRRGKADYEKGVDAWSKQYQSDEPTGEVRPGARNIRQDADLDGRTAAVRYNNPGAQYPSAAAERFGMTGYGIIGGGHKIAMFPSDVHGGAANMDNFARSYKGMTVASAVAKWRGGNGSLTPPEGFDPGERIDDAFLGDKGRMTDFFDKMSRHEGRGKAGSVASETWSKAFDMYRAGGVGAAPAKPTAFSTSPENESPGGTMPVPRQRMALPDRARIGDHAINEFTDLLPKIDKRLAQLENERIARFTVEGWRTGKIPFNANDAESRKLYDKVYGELGVGRMIATGDPRAILQATQDASRANYMAKDAYEGVKGLFDSTDPKVKQLGYDTVLNLYDRNPNIFDVHGGDSEMLKEAEHYRRLRRTLDADKAIARLIEEKQPDFKLRKAATKDEVDKQMKPYKDGATVHSQIAKDMDEAGWSKWFITGYGALGGRPQTDLERKQRAEMTADYTESLRDELERTGDVDKAKAGAISRFKHRYGVSNLFGRETVMPFPPERFYTANPTDKDGPFAYIEREIKEQVGIYNTAADPNSIRLRTLPQRYWQDGKPSYEVVVTRKDNGLEEVVPMRYVPGDPNAGAKFKEEDAKKRTPAPPPSEPGFTTPEGRKAATDKAIQVIPNKVPGRAPHEVLRDVLKGGDVVPLDGTERKPSVGGN